MDFTIQYVCLLYICICHEPNQILDDTIYRTYRIFQKKYVSVQCPFPVANVLVYTTISPQIDVKPPPPGYC